MNAPLRRRWLRFSLGTVFAVVAALLLWLGWNSYRVSRRANLEEVLSERGAMVLPYTGQVASPEHSKRRLRLPALWEKFGAKPICMIQLKSADGFLAEDAAGTADLFPEAQVWFMDDQGNKHLASKP